MADELQRIILEVVNADRIKALNEQLEDERKAIRFIKAELDAGRASQQQYESATRGLARNIKALNDEIRSLQRQGGVSGHSILQFQYILDDLLNTTGGLERKLAAISNNLPGFIQSLSGPGSSGLAGTLGIVGTALIALTPLALKAWEALAGEEKVDDARDRIREIRREIAAAQKEFEKLVNAPNTPEKLSAEGIKLFLEHRPAGGKSGAERARDVVAGALDQADVLAGMDPEARKELEGVRALAFGRDEDLKARAETEAARDYAMAGGQGAGPPQAMIDARYEALAKQREQARATHKVLMDKARQAAAAKIVAGAKVAGPEGAADRDRLLQATAGKEGFRELQDFRPENIRAEEEAFERQQEADEEEARKVDAAKRARERGRREVDAELRANEEKDQENLHEFQRGKARRKQAGAKADADIHRRAQAVPRDLAAERRNAVRNRVIRTTQAEGLGTPTADQADEMADTALRNMNAGMDAQSAIWSAVLAKVQALQAMSARFQQQQQMMQAQAMQLGGMGDFGGEFTPFPAMW